MSENKVCFGVDMSVEEWRTKPEWEGYYEFSNWGGARSLDRVVTSKNGRTRRIKGKMLTVSEIGQVQLSIAGTVQQEYLSYIIAELFINNYILGTPITYRDGNRANCRLDNLLVGSNKCSINSYTTCTRSSIIELYYSNETINNTLIIEGGFAEGGRILFDLTIADKIGKPVGDLRINNIIPNLDNWEKGVDYIDLMEYANFNDYIPLLLELGYTTHGIMISEHIYIFSERGVAKVMSTLKNSNPAKWEFLNNFVNEYFNMREQIKNQVPQLTRKQQLRLQLFSDDEMEVVAAHKELLKLEVQEATAPLIQTIEEQKPKVEKYKEYVDSDGYIAPRQAAQILKLPHPTAQAFNKLLKEHGIQYKSGKNWVLYEKYNWMLEKDYCKQVPYIDSNGTSHHNLRWTPKGLNYIRDNILNKP